MIGWTVGFVIASLARTSLALLRVGGLVTTGLTTILVLQASGWLPVRGWNQTGSS
ncbi:hypothetical protein V5P93_003173 [Actinokineospora auranticolor]|uniref:hypothetical protein n=1 Tax=Actinokineospora auranticolor TaxID=155976 RepID=UPI0015E3F9F9|nr:hypothetical protein [Actinokineospora auranticolor]